MMLVHFPAALLPVEFIFNVIANFTSRPELATVSYYCLMAGVIGGWIAVLSGLTDLFLYVLRSGESSNTGWKHGTIQFIAITGFTGILVAEYKSPAIILELPLWLVAGKISLLMMLHIGNYLGGNLVFNTVAKQFRSFKQ